MLAPHAAHLKSVTPGAKTHLHKYKEVSLKKYHSCEVKKLLF